jgi:hypothetical protein
MRGVPKASRNRMESMAVLAPARAGEGRDMRVSDMLTKTEHICMFEQMDDRLFEHMGHAGLPVEGGLGAARLFRRRAIHSGDTARGARWAG